MNLRPKIFPNQPDVAGNARQTVIKQNAKTNDH